MATLSEAVAWCTSWARQLDDLQDTINQRQAELAAVFGTTAFYGTDGPWTEKDTADNFETADTARRLSLGVDLFSQAIKQFDALRSRAVVLSDNVREVEARRAEARRKLGI